MSRQRPDSNPPRRRAAWAVVLLLAALAAAPAAGQDGQEDPGALPFGQPQPLSDLLPAPQQAGPRDLLNVYGIDESQLRMFSDGQPLGADDEETLVRILFRLPQFSLELLNRWAPPQIDRPALVAAPGEHRGDALRVAGRAKGVERVELLPEVAARFDFDHYYVVTLEAAGEAGRVLVCTRAVPQAWPVGKAIDERAAALGMFVKVGPRTGAHEDLVMAAPRVAWMPEQPQPAAGVYDELVLLADLGMDVGLFDDVRTRHRKRMGVEDRECFYQLLAAIGRADPQQLNARARRDVPFGPLLQQPEQQQGRLLMIEGTVRRVTKVLVGERDIQQRLGIDHYYQIDLFVPLGNQKVRLGEASEDKEAPTFEDVYPVVVCALRLPPELPEAADLHEDVRIAAVYFKLWPYRSEYVSSFDTHQLQISPMLIGLEPEVRTRELPANPWFGLAAGLGFLVVLGVLWWGLWRSGRSDARFDRRVLRRHRPSDRESLDASNLDDVPDKPDFSHLD